MRTQRSYPPGPDVRSPGSRTRSVHTCQVLRPRRVEQALAISHLIVLPSEQQNGLGTRDAPTFAAQWLAYVIPYRRFAISLTANNARLGADVVRYTFIVVDLHHLLPAGLPALLC